MYQIYVQTLHFKLSTYFILSDTNNDYMEFKQAEFYPIYENLIFVIDFTIAKTDLSMNLWISFGLLYIAHAWDSFYVDIILTLSIWNRQWPPAAYAPSTVFMIWEYLVAEYQRPCY